MTDNANDPPEPTLVPARTGGGRGIITSTEELDAIAERAEKATPGPWKADGAIVTADIYHVATVDSVPSSYYPDMKTAGKIGERIERNSAFVAAARTDVPRLVTLGKLFFQVLDGSLSVEDARNALQKS